MLGTRSRFWTVCSLAASGLVVGVWACTPGSVSSTPPAHHDPSADASVVDGGASAESGGGSDGAAETDGGVDCAKLLTAPILPNRLLGLDPTTTVDADGVLACATYVEPTTLPAGTLPRQPGYRVATFGAPDDAGASPVTLGFNVESRLPALVILEPGYLGTAQLTNGSTQSFAIEVGYPVQLNGAAFALPWTNTTSTDPNNLYKRVTEIYDATLFTWAGLFGLPNRTDTTDCHAASTCRIVPDDGAGHGVITFPQFDMKLTFDLATNVLVELSLGWAPNAPSCTTRAAAIERMDDWPIAQGPDGEGIAAVGGIVPPWGNAAPGDTMTQADTREGCGGMSVAAPDPGYAAMQWGPSGEVLFEYDADSGAGHAIFGRSGYRGRLTSGGVVVAVGSPVMQNGAPLPIDWTSVASATPVVTAIANHWAWKMPDTDCVAANDCTIVPDDGKGHSTFTLTDQSLQDPAWPTLTFVFPKGSSVPQEVIATE